MMEGENYLKNLVIFLAFFLVGGLATIVHAAEPEVKREPIIIGVTENKAVTLREAATGLGDYQVIFFGEYHDQRQLHELEFGLLKELYALHGDKLVLSLEMFEADQQSNLNKYLSGVITEEEFLRLERTWSNYQTDYRPLVEFAKEHK